MRRCDSLSNIVGTIVPFPSTSRVFHGDILPRPTQRFEDPTPSSVLNGIDTMFTCDSVLIHRGSRDQPHDALNHRSSGNQSSVSKKAPSTIPTSSRTDLTFTWLKHTFINCASSDQGTLPISFLVARFATGSELPARRPQHIPPGRPPRPGRSGQPHPPAGRLSHLRNFIHLTSVNTVKVMAIRWLWVPPVPSRSRAHDDV